MLDNSKSLLDVLQGRQPQSRPVWLMRQAGRYLPEYRALRAKAGSFLDLCLNPEYATEITLQPIRRFGMDAAILFADILLVPMALGLDLSFHDGEGPMLQNLPKDLSNLSYNPEKVAAVFATVREVKSQLDHKTTLIGFCGAPWTVACYMIDGNSRNDFAETHKWRKKNPEKLDALMNILVDASETYLAAQIDAGAEALQIFDSWAGLISSVEFQRYVIEPTQKLILRLKKRYPHIPTIGFPREAKAADYTAYIRATGIDAMSLDTKADIQLAKRDWQPIKPLQGNLDPEILLRGGDEMKRALENIMTVFGPRHIVNLGHGVVPQTPPEHVATMVRFVQEFGV